ncbi:MAG: adenosylmethionine--8-amino-7-oxononanoate transaminase [Gemmataceae bacterium]|nr:adenosylmethionine--8-amino-7-oxononanoate transaminase [Gemmataceae bacterium]
MQRQVILLGTDTDAGKTTFALLWLAAFARDFAYWKPVETGPSDTETVRSLVPDALVYPPVQRFTEPVAPPLAARREGRTVAAAAELAAQRPPCTDRWLLIETFGGPLSPLNDAELQLELISRLDGVRLLVASSTLGAIGRSLLALEALGHRGAAPAALVLIGPEDEFAAAQVQQHRPSTPVFSLHPPRDWTIAGVATAALEQRDRLEALRSVLAAGPTPQEEQIAVPLLRDLIHRDRSAVWHPYTSLREPTPPLPIVGAEAEFLHLADGRKVIDGISSWWTILHGHRHPALMEALTAAARRVDHVVFAGLTHPWAVALAELLLSTMPWTGGRVFYSDNGSTAVEVALKLAVQYWQLRGESRRTRFVGFQHGYHGDTFGAMAVSRDPIFFGRFEPLLCAADIIPLDPAALEEHLRRQGPVTAAIIIEPLVQGAGGMRMHPPETLRQLFEVSRRHQVLFIADEVMTGGRTPTRWAFQAAAIAPDLVCASKTLTGGILPLAATLVAPHVVAAFDNADRSATFYHGHSFTAHPLACAAAVANWKLLDDQALTRARRMQAFWESALAPLRGRRGVRDVRTCGSIAAVELETAGGYLAEVARVLRQTCLDHGVFLRPLGNVLYAMPPLETSTASLTQTAAAMTAAVERALDAN